MRTRALTRRAYAALRDRAWARLNRRSRAELAGERVVFNHLRESGDLARFQSSRILEIGPKHGEDSRLLASLDPAELVLLDLPSKTDLIDTWLASIQESVPTRMIWSNVLYMTPSEIEELGQFDLIWCLGVIYHNVEQLRLLRRLHGMLSPGGLIVVESSTTRNRLLARMNVVEVHWPKQYRGAATITHHPSRRAIKSWLEMVGFTDVAVRDVYSRLTAWQRAVLTASRPDHDTGYVSYVDAEGDNPRWVAGEAG